MYAAAKAAIVSFTRSAAATHGEDGITINAVCPNFVRESSPLLRFREGVADGEQGRESLRKSSLTSSNQSRCSRSNRTSTRLSPCALSSSSSRNATDETSQSLVGDSKSNGLTIGVNQNGIYNHPPDAYRWDENHAPIETATAMIAGGQT